MTRQETIRELQNDIQHNRIDEVELDRACEEHKLDLYEDLLDPIGYNTCDRCGDYGDSELDFLWLDGYEWEDGNPKDEALLRGLEKEGQEYCEVCWECVRELIKKGEQ